MASIPHLNTFRSGRRGPRRRGDSAGRITRPGEDDPVDEAESLRDKTIQQTDYDASSSRISAVSLGYLDDSFAKLFLPVGVEPPRRFPIINRGTYVRTKAIDSLVARFLDTHPDQRKQIVSLGAGSDTRFFRLCLGRPPSSGGIAYHELDFEANVNRKRLILRDDQSLSRAVYDAEKSGTSYNLCAIDLRDLTAKSPPVIPYLNPELPTLLLSECCLCYLPPDTTSSILHYFSMHIHDQLAIILYEPIRPFDSFGKTMVSNLASRGIHLQTLQRYSSLEAERQRLKLAGFVDGQGARDVLQLWQDNNWTPATERTRIEKLEWLDEVEEWQLLASHYCVAWAWKGDIFSQAWNTLQGHKTDQEDGDISLR